MDGAIYFSFVQTAMLQIQQKFIYVGSIALYTVAKLWNFLQMNTFEILDIHYKVMGSSPDRER